MYLTEIREDSAGNVDSGCKAKVFTTMQDGQFQEQKILNDAGGVDEQLLQQSENNKKKQKAN
jgi:hypothetical protein